MIEANAVSSTNNTLDKVQTRIGKGIRNTWEAESQIELPSGYILKVKTRKTSNGNILTDATCWQKGSTSGLYTSMTHAMYSDYSEDITNTRDVRCTEKVVRTQHYQALANLILVIQRAETHNNKLLAAKKAKQGNEHSQQIQQSNPS
jgi:hypothetical protein